MAKLIWIKVPIRSTRKVELDLSMALFTAIVQKRMGLFYWHLAFSYMCWVHMYGKALKRSHLKGAGGQLYWKYGSWRNKFTCIQQTLLSKQLTVLLYSYNDSSDCHVRCRPAHHDVLGSIILPKDTSACRLGELNQQPSKTLISRHWL